MDRLKDTVYLVEANRNEQSTLWDQNRKSENPVNWEEDLSGYGPRVGIIDDRPIHISLLWAKLNGHRVLFWHPTSQVVDHIQIDEWFKKHCPTLFPKEGRHFSTDAQNFHLCVHHILSINE